MSESHLCLHAGARVVTLPECGHSMMAEAPDGVLDALRIFLLDASAAPTPPPAI